MTDILDEIIEIPFDIFWHKYQEIKPGIYDQLKAQKEWFYMKESDRDTAFEQLAKGHPAILYFGDPYEYLQHFNLPF
jgi:hypothetical protein